MTGEVLFAGVGGDLDNMEGLAVHEAPSGQTRITLVSDNNFNDWERNLLLEFSCRNECKRKWPPARPSFRLRAHRSRRRRRPALLASA